MACEAPKQVWDKLKKEFQGSDKTRQQQLINVIRDFENLKMREAEIMKQYADKTMSMVNSIKLLRDQFSDRRVVEKVINTLPGRSQAADGNQAQEEHLFTASCFGSNSKVNKSWLIDSGCTNYMTSDESIFRKIDTSFASKVRIRNG
ncbi:golgin subfamily A member 3-like [Gossypium australe]|uniref:Golgin subfamily A member 3-like n=1 Tax=Gossypium australe TaxID=47621 RepID=A0A5B6X412_9ROSI|nr:golgin subfamily A member 3-like [Gossypium australe]